MIAVHRRSGLRHFVHPDGIATLCGRVMHRRAWAKIKRARTADCQICKKLKGAK